ncbi:MAG TPA: DMT family transporter [Candidatus Sulfotelmatobacter sp.]|jgi:drug/metabolite transporter (DMT)-like permease|nr:DMT family transporter [Candidatus Sulfotelmatobacter sp.]
MQLNRERQGELYILGSVTLWGLFPVITVLSYNTLSPLISLSCSSIFAALVFAAIITKKKKWNEVGNRAALKNVLATSVLNGIIYYLLIFFGLQFTTPGNASIVALTEIFFSFLFFHVFQKEHIPVYHILGALFMIVGALIVLAPNLKSFHPGDMLILLASSIAPFGNFFAQKARKQVTSETIMLVRSTLSGAVILFLALLFHTQISTMAIQNSLFFLLINGLLLLGLSKILWLDGIHRISVMKANSLGSISPVLTLFFAWLILKQIPTLYQLLAIFPILVGVILLSKQKNQLLEEAKK